MFGSIAIFYFSTVLFEILLNISGGSNSTKSFMQKLLSRIAAGVILARLHACKMASSAGTRFDCINSIITIIKAFFLVELMK